MRYIQKLNNVSKGNEIYTNVNNVNKGNDIYKKAKQCKQRQ